MVSASVTLLSIVIFSALVINLALQPAHSARLTAILMAVSVLGGCIFYGFGYTQSGYPILMCLLRVPFSVMGMFLGKNDLSVIGGAPIISSQASLLIFWLLHFLAFYSMASAAMITVGSEGLRRLRLLLALNGDLTIIYGINERSLQVGKECLAKKDSAVVYITEKESTIAFPEVIARGMAVLSGTGAVHSEIRDLKMLRVGSRKRIEVFALDTDNNKNLSYVLGLKESFEKLGVEPKITSVTLPGTEEILAGMLQVSPDRYGFGYVNVFDPMELMARAMIRLCPPWNCLTFDKAGRAEQNFDCIVIGSGASGQAVLRHLIMNAQFVGSKFHAAVFSINYDREAGLLLTDCPELPEKYDIEVYRNDARSKEFYEYLRSRLGGLKYIAVCAGSNEKNTEITDHLMLYLKRVRMEHICVVACTREGVRYQESVGSPIQNITVRSMEMLSAKIRDKNAILINSAYDTSERSDWEKWVACDTFSKMSSRASADFIPALIKASGDTPEEIMRGKWENNKELLDVLGETEHLRWSAFHFCMGYRPMSEAELIRNMDSYIHCRDNGLPLPRITKNADLRTHACLIPYDQLDALSARENSVTGRSVDYKQMDINNVLMIPDILRAEGRQEKAREDAAESEAEALS